MTSGLTD